MATVHSPGKGDRRTSNSEMQKSSAPQDKDALSAAITEMRNETATMVKAIRRDAADQMNAFKTETAAIFATQMEEFRRQTSAQMRESIREVMQSCVQQNNSQIEPSHQHSQSQNSQPLPAQSAADRPHQQEQFDLEAEQQLDNDNNNARSDQQATTSHHSDLLDANSAEQRQSSYTGTLADINISQQVSGNASFVGNGFRPKLYDLPEFDGRPEDWLIFKAEFTQTTADYGYSNSQNTSRLRKSLKGEARELVSCLLVRPENVPKAMEMLERQFGKPQFLVASQLRLIRDLPRVDEQRLEMVIPLAAKVATMATYLDHPNTIQHLQNPMLIEEIIAKLPSRERREWGKFASQIVPYPTVKDLSEWLDTVADFMSRSSLQYPRLTEAARTPGNSRRPLKGSNHFTLLTEESPVVNTPRACGMCLSLNHTTAECYSLLNLNSDERYTELRKNQICTCCLAPRHVGGRCPRRKPCGINNCRQRHHPLLHGSSNFTEKASSKTTINRSPNYKNRDVHTSAINKQQARNNPFDRSSQSQSTSEQRVQPGISSQPTMLSIRNREPDILFRVLPVMLFGPSRMVQTHALLDEGSSVTMIDEDLAKELQLDGNIENLNLNWFGDKHTTEKSRNVNVRISGIRHKDPAYVLKNVHTVKGLKLPTQSIRLSDIHSRYHHMRHLPIVELQNATPKLLIGLDHCHLGVATRVVGGDAGGAVAAKTKLGWIVYGQHPQDAAGSDATVLHVNADERLNEIERTVAEYFTTENFGVYQPECVIESDEITHARRVLRQTTKRIGHQFQTGLLWKEDRIALPPNRQMALNRLLSIESKMRRDAEYKKQYRHQISEYIRKNYAREMSEEEARETSPNTWYLPHFGVLNPHKPGKFRIVFDAAAAVRGISLNAVLSKGPDLHKPLPDILFKFRTGKVGVCGDICEMFSQIKIQPIDQDAQRFLWRDGDPTQQIKTYVMTSMTFGATCSPCSAHYVKNINAEEHREFHPEAAKSIIDRHYVDDYVASFPTASKAIEVTKAVTEINRRGGFDLRGFVSNFQSVQDAVGGISRATTPVPSVTRSMELDPDATDKILGLFWDTEADKFVFRCRFYRVPLDVLEQKRRPTRREMLSLTMSVFDPFGMVANFMIGAKLLVQETWKLAMEWDDPIPDIIYQRWSTWQSKLPLIENCYLPRCYSPHFFNSDEIHLHIFADASELAFAAVAYWRIKRPDGGWDVAFVAGKTRCAPKQLLSVPRLELQASVLAVRLSQFIRHAHDRKDIRVVYWSDSRTVVCWIRSHHRRFKPFVAHRVAEILQKSDISEWHWIPTAENVADDATRANLLLEFDSKSRWLLGPKFLRRPESEWPTEPPTVIDEDLPEQIKPKFNLHTTYVANLICFQRFSTYERLRRTTAWLLRFVNNTKKEKSDRTTGELHVAEMRDAETLLCRLAQHECFGNEVDALKREEAVPENSSIYSLRPYMDSVGTIRLQGRIDAANHLAEETRRPIILPKQHILTSLIVLDEHVKMRHQNDEAVICAIRVRFWIPHVRNVVRRVKRNCQYCKIRGARPIMPLMGSLPLDRVIPVQRPFTYTGLDYFGPVFVTVGRRREKRWVALFTCMTIRAVHLELAADLSTDACILCLRNFVNLRGVPIRIRSDNGTNFIGASRELRECIDAFDQNAIEIECGRLGIEWIFNCPSNPEAGGCWERLVRSVKRVLAVTLKEVAPRVETMRSLLLEAANIVNSRPLTHVPVNSDDDEPLTPNHFLLGTLNSTQTPETFDPKLNCSRKQWRIAQNIKNHFWQRWVREYLPELTRRTKWFKPSKPLETGDLVIICDPDLPRSQWPRGRIKETFPGKDGQVRSARVQTVRGELRRPASKLAVLDVTARIIG